MKKIINIAIIILILVGFCTAEQIITQKFYKETKAQVETIREISLQNEDVNTTLLEEKARFLEKEWSKKESFLWTFISHKEVRDIGVEISKLISAIKENNRETFTESLDLISFYIEMYSSLSGINLQNIF